MKGWKLTVAFLTGAMLVAALLRSCVVTSCLIPSTGMETTLYKGERVFVNKWSYGLRLPFMWGGYHRWGNGDVDRGDVVVFNNPANFSERSINRREVFIGRCIGLPGDTLAVDSLFAAKLVGEADFECLSLWERYKEQLMLADSIVHEEPVRELRPLIIPKRGQAVRVTPWNMTLLRNTLVLHEGRYAEVHDDTLYIDGRQVWQCYFTQDYYWVGSDNSANLSDSRLFGFVPESHLIGRATVVWFSQKEREGVPRGIRWNRMLKRVR